MNMKTLIGSIITITLLILVSTTSAVDANTTDRKKVEPLDNGEKEKITYIDGSCLGVEFNGPGFFRNVEINAGWDTWFTITAITSFLPFKSYQITAGRYIKAPFFIGIVPPMAPGRFAVKGYAIGDIEWSG